MKAAHSLVIRDFMQAATLLLAAFFLGSVIPSNSPEAGTYTHEMADYEEVKAASVSGASTIIDTRDEAIFNGGHIPGAVNLPLKSFDGSLNTLDLKKKTIVYCSDRGCADSEKLAVKLAKAGFTNIAVYKGGWEEWIIIEGE